MSRFTVIGKQELLVLVEEKSAVSVELQEGTTTNPLFELVVQEMYWKADSKDWAYCRGGLRIPCNKENIKHITDGIVAMYKLSTTSKKDVKEIKKTSIDDLVKTMNPTELLELIKMLQKSESKAESKTEGKKTTKKEEPQEETNDMELLLNAITAINKKGKKK